MDKQKLERVMEALEEVTFLEWQKFKCVVDHLYECKGREQLNKTAFPATEEIINRYQREYGFTPQQSE